MDNFFFFLAVVLSFLFFVGVFFCLVEGVNPFCVVLTCCFDGVLFNLRKKNRDFGKHEPNSVPSRENMLGTGVVAPTLPSN